MQFQKYFKKGISLFQWLGVFLSIALFLTILSLVAFANIADAIIDNEEIVLFDQALTDELHTTATPAVTDTFIFISLFGSQVVFVISAIVAVFYALRRQWLHLVIWLGALIGGELLNLLLKTLFARPRPIFDDPLAVEIHYSFPSGHAMMSLIAYGMFAYFIMLRVRGYRLRILIAFGAVMLIVLIGISRIYLGVHYFSDVVAGFLIGSAWLSACILAMGVIRRRSQREPPDPLPIGSRVQRDAV